jgi:hypothetical protein
VRARRRPYAGLRNICAWFGCQPFANAFGQFVIAPKLNMTPIKKVITSICRPGRIWLCAHYASRILAWFGLVNPDLTV